MDPFGLDISQLIELHTQVAQAGAIHAAMTDAQPDDTFDYTVGIAVLIHEQSHPR